MRRYSADMSPNVCWNLNADLGINFENYVANLIVQQLSGYHPEVTVQQTKRVGDGGKDIVVISQKDSLEILGQKFYLNGKKEVKIFFECKSTNENVLRYEKIVSSSSRSKYHNIDYYVLVTNSSILPQTFYYISNDLLSKNIIFRLIDSYLLGAYISKTECPKALGNPYFNCEPANFYYEYQVESYNSRLSNEYTIYFFFRNYTDLDKYCNLQLVTDVDWEGVAEEYISFIIAPNSAVVKKIVIRQNYYDGIPQLSFRININGTETAVIINGINGTRIFEPPFIGEDRKQLVDKLSGDLKKADAPNLIFFWGDAGIGKTRITEELARKLIGTNFDYGQCRVQKEHSPKEQICTFLKDKGYLTSSDEADFTQTIEHCTKVGWRAIFVIDDFHNARKEFINEIKKLKDSKAPITFIICGRTDFSAGDLNYVTFIKWTKDHIPGYSFDISPLDDKDTKNLIKILIEDIPEFALDRLFKLSMNNPLFIIQFIEYLLDTELVKLVHRNTVSIVNINKFHSKKFIPNKISEIYRLRIENLLNQNKGQECLDFLYKLALCNGSIDSENRYKIFESESENIEKLLNRRILKFTANGDITFIHESFLLFIESCLNNNHNHRKILANELLDKQNLRFLLDDFQIGKLNLYARKYKEAESKFFPIFCWLETVDNFSNNNVDTTIYEYLIFIPELALHNKKLINIAKKALMMRIYITLHHFAPINAVNECDRAIEIINKYKLLKDYKLKLSILELKAHSLMNSGLYPDGETLLKELQALWIGDNYLLNDQTLFDLYDRFASIYRHFNLKSLAEQYNNLSIKLAEHLQNDGLKMLANRTKFKIYLYSDIEVSKISLKEGKELNKKYPSNRIETDNDLDACGLRILSEVNHNWEQLINEIDLLCSHAKKNGFNRAQIHGYFLLAICNLKYGTPESLYLAYEYTEKAINYSAVYGIVGYLWRLHNLKAIIQMRLNYDADKIYKEFCTVFEILQNRGLLYIGNRDVTHGNIFAISNYGYYLQEHQFESLFYEKMNLITYTDKNRNLLNQHNTNKKNKIDEFLVRQYMAARDKKVLFVDSQPSRLLRDSQTNYIIIL